MAYSEFTFFIISASPKRILLTVPIISIVEAKNENIKSGIPQCIAEMYATQLFNLEKIWGRHTSMA